MADVVRRGSRFRQVEDQFGDVIEDPFQALGVILLVDVADQEDRRGRLGLDQVRRRDAAGDAAVAHHRQVVDVVARHGHQGVEAVVVGLDADGIKGHDLRQRRVIGDALGDDPVAQVPVGEDAAEASRPR